MGKLNKVMYDFARNEVLTALFPSLPKNKAPTLTAIIEAYEDNHGQNPANPPYWSNTGLTAQLIAAWLKHNNRPFSMSWSKETGWLIQESK